MSRNPVTRFRSAITSSTIKRGWQEFINQPVLQAGALRKGDILLVNLYEDFQYWQDVDRMAPYAGDIGGDGNSILVAQAVFSHIKHGSATSEHVLMVCDDGGEASYESMGCGVIRSNQVLDRWHAVYRVVAGRQALADEAAEVAKSLSSVMVSGTGQLVTTTPAPAGTGPTESSVKYRSQPGMASSVFRLRAAGPFRNARLKRVYDVVYNNDRKARNGLRMICSEFVTTCYEVAAMRLGLPPILNVDPRSMTAKALEATLYKRASYFPRIGIYKGSQPMVRRCGTCQGQVRCMYIIDQQGNRCTMNNANGKARYPYITICPQCNVCPHCSDVWAATFDPDGGTAPVFFCRNCEAFPQAGGMNSLNTDITGSQGGHIQMGGMRKKPLKSDDTFFVR